MSIRKIIPYDSRLKELARQLRNNSTLAEVLLWRELKSGKMLGFDFHRQKPIDEYIVDFFCPELLLVVEIDGVSHDYQYDKDIARQKRLESFGLTVIRFGDKEVKKSLNNILAGIENWIEEHTPRSRHTSGPPLSRGD